MKLKPRSDWREGEADLGGGGGAGGGLLKGCLKRMIASGLIRYSLHHYCTSWELLGLFKAPTPWVGRV